MPYRTQWPSTVNPGTNTTVSTISTNTSLADDSVTSYDTLTIASGVTLTLGLRAVLNIKNTLTVNGTIAGSQTGTNPTGAGTDARSYYYHKSSGNEYYGGPGAGHYTTGGGVSATNGSLSGGSSYDNVTALGLGGTFSTTLQTGATGGMATNGGSGGAGGGAFKIVAASIVVNATGVIHADGAKGNDGTTLSSDGAAGSGGGSGGTVWIVTGKLSGSGIIRANGGNGGAGKQSSSANPANYGGTGGNGSPGRVRIDAGDTSGFTGTTTSTGNVTGYATITSGSANSALITYLTTAKGDGTTGALSVAAGTTTTLTGTAPTFNYTSITLGNYSTLIVPNLTTIKATGTISIGTGAVIRVASGNIGPAAGQNGIASVYKGSGGGGGGHVTSGEKGGCGRIGTGNGTAEDCSGHPGGYGGTFYDYISGLAFSSVITANMGGSSGGAGGNCDSGFGNTKNYNYAVIKNITSTSSAFTVNYETPGSGVQFNVGGSITISGATNTSYNGSWTVATSGAGTITVTNASNYGASGYDGIIEGTTSTAATNTAKAGGAGGGVLKIICDTFSCSGRVIADGVSAEYIMGNGGSNDTTAGGGGGGSGGFVWIQCSTLSGTNPIIRANGGSGGSSVPTGSGGSGANGRVKINAVTTTSWSGATYGTSEISFSSASDSALSLPQYQFADGMVYWQ